MKSKSRNGIKSKSKSKIRIAKSGPGVEVAVTSASSSPTIGVDMTTADLVTDLTPLVPPGGVLTDPAGLFVYESDGFTVAKARPAAVVFPTCTAEVVAVVKRLAERGVQIVPRGSG